MLVGQTAFVLLASDFFCAQISRFPIYTDCLEASKFQKSELYPETSALRQRSLFPGPRL